MKQWAMPAACISALDALGAATLARVGPKARSGGEIISTKHFKLYRKRVFVSVPFIIGIPACKCKPFNKAHAQAIKHFFMPPLTES